MRRFFLFVLVLGISLAGCTAVGSLMDGMAGYPAIPPSDDPRWFMLGSIILPVLKDLIQLVIQFGPMIL